VSSTVPEFPAHEITTVYTLYTADRAVLYVGVTNAFLARFQEHALQQAWWADVRHADLEHFEFRSDAVAREQTLIAALRPLHNKTLTKAGHVDSGPPIGCRQCGDVLGGSSGPLCAACKQRDYRRRKAEAAKTHNVYAQQAPFI